MKKVIPLREQGLTYEDTYGGWLEFFRNLAVSKNIYSVECPVSWAPLVEYMGHNVARTVVWFPEDYFVHFEHVKPEFYKSEPNGEYLFAANLRRIVEMSSTCRPEIVHALFLWDTLWRFKNAAKERTRDLRHLTIENNLKSGQALNITCNGSFFRPEIYEYLDRLSDWEPQWDGVKPAILVPCAADKPYPAPMHKKVIEACPDAYLLVVTGVLGIVPQDLWPHMPNYDSGLPNFDRVQKEVRNFFKMHGHCFFPVISYSDHYNHAIWNVLGERIGYIFPHGPCNESYEDLLNKRNLRKLKKEFSRASCPT